LRHGEYAEFWGKLRVNTPVSHSAQLLLQRLFTADARDRPTFADISSDGWLTADPPVPPQELKVHVLLLYSVYNGDDEPLLSIADKLASSGHTALPTTVLPLLLLQVLAQFVVLCSALHALLPAVVLQCIHWQTQALAKAVVSTAIMYSCTARTQYTLL
jgi:hypothetical protein